MNPATDQLLGGRYLLRRRIAGGGMGEVWRALDEALGREVAVKILRREYADDATFLERFRAEARHAAGLSHPAVAAVYDFGEGTGEDESPYLVMEHVPGEPLSALVAREGPLTPQRTLEIVGEAALGLQAAHDAGVIHRDVKPGNLLVTPAGAVKVTDFGIARAANAVPLTQTGAIMGTAYYISPEQASGSSVTPASDLYSLGVVAYECLSGRRPFTGDTPVSVALAQVRETPPDLPPGVPVAVRDLVMAMLAKEPERRPTSAGAVGAAALALAPTLADVPGVDPADDSTQAIAVVPAAAADGAGAAGGGADGAGAAGGGAAAAGSRRRDPSDTDPDFRLPEPERRPAWLPYAVLAVVVLLVVLVTQAVAGEGDPAPSPSARATEKTTSTAPTSVDLVRRDYLGRDGQEVAAELTDLGLRVKVRETAGGGAVGTVKDVEPTGTVDVAELVTLAVVAAPATPDAVSDDDVADVDDDDQPGNSDKGKNKGKDKTRGQERDDE